MSRLNMEVHYKGTSFHIQTQDMRSQGTYVESLIYHCGKLISSRKTYYTEHLQEPDFKDKIKEIIEGQQQSILREISEGKFDPFLK